MRLLSALMALVIVGVFVWFHDFKEPPTREDACSPYVTSTTEKIAHGATTAGDILHQLKDDATAWTEAQIDEAMKGAGVVWGIVWKAFKLAAKVGKVKADKAVTGMVPTPIDCTPCPTDGGQDDPAPSTPPDVEPWDPKDASLASLSSSSPERVARNAARRYFPASQIDIATAVAGAESSWNPDPPHPPTVNGGTMRGLWQINDGAHPDLVRGRDWRNPSVNAWMAYQVWLSAPHGGRNWTPWSTYNSGSYKRFLHKGATAAIPAPEPLQPGTPDACSSSAPPRTQSVASGKVRHVKDPSSGKTYDLEIPAGPRGVAVSFAVDQLGDPYQWAAHGPNRWDCSGLVAGAWGKAGVRMTPQTEAMRRELTTTRTPKVGDLAYRYGHVQMVVGKGLILEAPRTGLRVRIVRQWMRPSVYLDPTQKKGLMI